jgi:hypothetical protein
MWGVEPSLLCREHLLGEHREMHQEVGLIRAGHLAAVEGHADHGQVDTALLQERHDTLVDEMERRGYTHDSPMDYDDDLGLGAVDPACNREELRDRCAACRERIEQS